MYKRLYKTLQEQKEVRKKENQIQDKNMQKHSTQKILWRVSKTSASSQDGVTGIGFTLLTETTAKPDKIYEKEAFSNWASGSTRQRSVRKIHK